MIVAEIREYPQDRRVDGNELTVEGLEIAVCSAKELIRSLEFEKLKLLNVKIYYVRGESRGYEEGQD